MLEEGLYISKELYSILRDKADTLDRLIDAGIEDDPKYEEAMWPPVQVLEPMGEPQYGGGD